MWLSVARVRLLAAGLSVGLTLLAACGDSPAGSGTPSQEDMDCCTAYGIVSCFCFIWNQNLAGMPGGPVDMFVPGPQGGTVHIYGSTSYDGNIQTCDLTLDMTACESSNQYYDLALTGSLVCSGSWSDEYKAMGYTSSALTFTGTLTIDGNTVDVDETGTISITETLDYLSGEICGRSFSY